MRTGAEMVLAGKWGQVHRAVAWGPKGKLGAKGLPGLPEHTTDYKTKNTKVRL